MEDNGDNFLPVTVDCSAVSQLPEASQSELDGALLLASVSSEGVEGGFESKKITLRELNAYVSASLSVDGIREMSAYVQSQISALQEDDRWLCCDLDHPHVLTAIHEVGGMMTEARGYPLSTHVWNSLQELSDYIGSVCTLRQWEYEGD